MGAWDDERIGEGTKMLTVSRIGTTFQGKPRKTKAGDPAIMVTFKDELGVEADCIYMLAGKMKWKLLSLLVATGTSKEALEKQKVTPEMFAIQAICDQFLLHRRFTAEVKMNGDYTEVSPVDPNKPPTSAPDKDDIPF